MKTFRFELGVFTLSAVLLLPEQAFAYLDPGTGNALVYGLISLASVGAYAMKSAFYWLIRKKNHEQPSSATQTEGLPSLLIYSEGKNYWDAIYGIDSDKYTVEYRIVYLNGEFQ